MPKIRFAIGWAYEDADYPTRYELGLIADGSVGGASTALALPIDITWQANYPFDWELRRDTLHSNLRIHSLTITIDGVEFSLYQTLSNWGDRLRQERAVGNCQITDPLSERYTISGIEPPPCPPAAGC